MHPALEKVKRFLERNKMLDGVRGVVVAVSGGADSVALLDVLNQISSIDGNGPRLHIAHLNHKLRGSESDEDAAFVRRVAGRLGLPVTIIEAEVRLAAESAGRGIEEIAREMRYDFLLRVARDAGFDLIATGHTMSDQAETFLMRLTRGTGLRGLAAMRPISPVPCFDEEMGREGEGEMGRGGEGETGRGGEGETGRGGEGEMGRGGEGETGRGGEGETGRGGEGETGRWGEGETGRGGEGETGRGGEGETGRGGEGETGRWGEGETGRGGEGETGRRGEGETGRGGEGETGRGGEGETGRGGEGETGRRGEGETGRGGEGETGRRGDGASKEQQTTELPTEQTAERIAASPRRPLAPSPSLPLSPSPLLPLAPSPHLPVSPSPSPLLPIAPSPHLPVSPSPPLLLAPSPHLPVSPSALLIRPLLCLTREDVEEYCRDRELDYRTDASNLETHYTRNRMRLEVLPALREINPRVVESLARAAEIAAADQDALDQLACKMLDEARETPARHSPVQTDQVPDGKRAAYSVAKLLEHPAGLTRRMIIEAIDRLRPALKDRRERSTQIDSSHIAAVEALLAPESSGKRITLPDGLCAWREFDKLVFISSDKVEREPPAYQLEISAAKPLVEAGGLQITLEWESSKAFEGALDQAKRLKRLIGGDWMMAALDRNSLPGHLIVRPRRRGERAHVVGQGKTKKLKKLMIDHRIPPSLRYLWPIVATADDRYVWSPGLPPAIEFAASDETLGLAILRASGA